MKVPLSWLRELCPTKLSAEALADVMTEHGLEVEQLKRPWSELRGVVVARVLEVRDHPNADKLCVAAVDAGGSQREVVAGVRNMGPGDLVPYAPPGSTLPGFPGPLERKELRGITSEGMLCSPKELAISGDHGGILVLPAGADPGMDLAELLGLDDVVIDLEVRSNRPDTMSMVGVAREVAAMTGEDLLVEAPLRSDERDTGGPEVSLEVLDPERCPRYLARVVSGVSPGPSPLAVQVRLSASGMRPISAVVDATNYVMVETGQPLHPFDLAKLEGPGIVVRTAKDGERITTLDGVARDLLDEDLLICDLSGPVAIAGVMGGASTEVSDSTGEILLESATFRPASIFRTSRRLGLRSEASTRFERGVDPEAAGPAAARAAGLIGEWAGGDVIGGEVVVGEVPERRTVAIRPSRARSLLGIDLPDVEVREALGRLRLPVAGDQEDRLDVEIPGYRVDLHLEADLVEEVGRMAGYDRVPSTLPRITHAGGLTGDQRRHRRIRDILAGAGMWELQSTSFVPPTDLGMFSGPRSAGIRIANPVADDQAYLRSSLIPGLLRAARRNVSHRLATVRLFEVGTVFLLAGEDAAEAQMVAGLLTGPAGEGWPGDIRAMDFLNCKGIVEHLVAALGVEDVSFGTPAGPPFHPGRSAQVILPGGVPAGQAGELHPRVAREHDLPGRVAVFELRTDPLVDAVPPDLTYRDISRFPPVHRDLAFLVAREVPAGEVKAAVARAAGGLLDRLFLFDEFEGDPLPEGTKNLAFSLDFRAANRTLTDEEVDETVRVVAARLREELGAELRTG